MKIVAVINPATRRAVAARKALRQVAASLAVPEPTFVETTREFPGETQARVALAESADVVVAIGGDGTVRRVAGVLAQTAVPLAVIPSGTANLFALNVGIPRRNLAAAARIALGAATRTVDIGNAHAHRQGRPPTEHPFLVVAGLGNDAETLADVPFKAKGHVGWLAYAMTGVRHLAAPPVHVTLDGQHTFTWCALIGISGRLPLGVHVFPGAKPDDGYLHTLVLPLTSTWQWTKVVASGVLRRPLSPLCYGTAGNLTIGVDAPTLAQVDGDPIGEVTGLEVSIRPRALRIRAPH